MAALDDGLLVTVHTDGVVRLRLSADYIADGVEQASRRLRAFVDHAFSALGHARIELLIDPEDAEAQRVATWSGLQREGTLRGAAAVAGERVDRVLFSRLLTDIPLTDTRGFRAILNSFLPRKRAIAQVLVRDEQDRVLMCNLTYKADWDLPGGVVEVGESPQLAVSRELEEELGIRLNAGTLALTDWLPPWSGWDDALCLVYDGGQHDGLKLREAMTFEAREIRTAEFLTLEQIRERATDFTARRVEVALSNLQGHPWVPYTESGRPSPSADE